MIESSVIGDFTTLHYPTPSIPTAAFLTECFKTYCHFTQICWMEHTNSCFTDTKHRHPSTESRSPLNVFFAQSELLQMA